MTVSSKEILQLENELASIFVNNSKTADLVFLQRLVNLVKSHPLILHYAREIPPSQSGESFILLLLDRVFKYSMAYSHPTYNPYYPRNSEEFNLVDAILERHFPDLRPGLTSLFYSLGTTNLREDTDSDLVSPGNFNGRNSNENPKKKTVRVVPQHEPLLEDPGIHEEALQFLWVPSATEKFEFPEDLKTSYPVWAKGVISSMQRTLKIYRDLKVSRQHMKMTRGEIRVQPHHRMLRILMGAEFYWIFNKRQVDLGRSIPNARIMDLIQGFLYTVYDLFMSIYAPDHPVHKEMELGGGKTWKFERVRGTGGAPKVLTVYEDEVGQYLIQCTELSINLKKHSSKKSEVISSQETTQDELDQVQDLPVADHADHGIDEDILWKLYSNRRQRIDETIVWSEDFLSKFPLWSQGIISSMNATLVLYHEFKRSRYRVKSFDTIHIQPHHQLIWILIAAEYFWLYNTREVALPDDLTSIQAQVLMNAHFQEIAEEFRKLLPPTHPAIKNVKDKESETWKAERIRGTGGVPQVVFKMSLPKEKEYLVKCTASVLALQSLSLNSALDKIKEQREAEKIRKTFVKETEDSPLPISDYSDPGLDEHIFWSLYSRKDRDPVGWEDHVTDTFPLWARATINAMKASKSLYDDFHRNKRRYKRFESKRLQPNHVLIKFLITAEYYWLFNLREMAIPRDLGFKESREMQQSYLYDIQYEFIKLLPMQHPLRSKSPKLFRDWTAERIRGSSGASKVIVRLIDSRAEYLLEMTNSMVAVRKIKDRDPEA